MKPLENQIFCLNEHIVFAVFEEGGVALNLEDRVSHVLNRTGAGVLELLDGKRNLEEVIEAFTGMYEQPEEAVKKDIADFLTDLEERGWIYAR